MQHLAIRKFHVKPGQREKILQEWQEKIAPLLTKQSGFIHAYVVLDPNEDKFAIISVWENIQAKQNWRNTQDHWNAHEEFWQYLAHPIEKEDYNMFTYI